MPLLIPCGAGCSISIEGYRRRRKDGNRRVWFENGAVTNECAVINHLVRNDPCFIQSIWDDRAFRNDAEQNM